MLLRENKWLLLVLHLKTFSSPDWLSCIIEKKITITTGERIKHGQ